MLPDSSGYLLASRELQGTVHRVSDAAQNQMPELGLLGVALSTLPGMFDEVVPRGGRRGVPRPPTWPCTWEEVLSAQAGRGNAVARYIRKINARMSAELIALLRVEGVSASAGPNPFTYLLLEAAGNRHVSCSVHGWRATLSTVRHGGRCPACAQDPTPRDSSPSADPLGWLRNLVLRYPTFGQECLPDRSGSRIPLPPVGVHTWNELVAACDDGQREARSYARVMSRLAAGSVSDMEAVANVSGAPLRTVTGALFGDGRIRVTWRCPAGHCFTATLAAMRRGQGCPGCGDTSEAPDRIGERVNLSGAHAQQSGAADVAGFVEDVLTRFPCLAGEIVPPVGAQARPGEAVAGWTWADLAASLRDPGQVDAERDTYVRALRMAWDETFAGAVLPSLVQINGLNVGDVLFHCGGARVSNTGLLWRCAGGHYTFARVGKFRADPWCPHCEGVRPPARNLADSAPEAARAYDPRDNDGVPAAWVPQIMMRLTWRCPEGRGHTWVESIYQRFRRDSAGCPGCGSGQPTPLWNLTTVAPKIADALDPAHHPSPEAVRVTLTEVLHFRCDAAPDHGWSRVLTRTDFARGAVLCPACAGRQLSATNSVAGLPDVLRAALNNPHNDGVKLGEVRSHDSVTRLWWQCPEEADHLWQDDPAKVTRNSHDGASRRGGAPLLPCPFCAGKRVCLSNSIQTKHPDVAQFWDGESNGATRPRDVLPTSRKEYGWRCPGGHTWVTSPLRMTARPWACPTCHVAAGGRTRTVETS